VGPALFTGSKCFAVANRKAAIFLWFSVEDKFIIPGTKGVVVTVILLFLEVNK
jgi:hypothetical protein